MATELVSLWDENAARTPGVLDIDGKKERFKKKKWYQHTHLHELYGGGHCNNWVLWVPEPVRTYSTLNTKPIIDHSAAMDAR